MSAEAQNNDMAAAENTENEEAVIYEEPESPQRQANSEVFSVSRDAVNYFIIAALFLGLGVFLGMNLSSDSVDSDELRTVVEEVVQENTAEQLVQLQEIVLGAASGGTMDAEALQALVQAAVEDATAEQVNYLADDDPFIGPEDAPIVVVEFSDFLCSFCGRHYEQTLTPLLEQYDGLIRYVYRDFPGVGGQNAVQSAMAAECANDQGRFWDYHDLLFSEQQSLYTDSISALNNVLVNHAETLELDMDEFSQCLESREHFSDVVRDQTEGQQNGVQGTPGFFINGSFISGAQPIEIFQAVIDDELEALGIDPSSAS